MTRWLSTAIRNLGRTAQHQAARQLGPYPTKLALRISTSKRGTAQGCCRSVMHISLALLPLLIYGSSSRTPTTTRQAWLQSSPMPMQGVQGKTRQIDAQALPLHHSPGQRTGDSDQPKHLTAALRQGADGMPCEGMVVDRQGRMPLSQGLLSLTGLAGCCSVVAGTLECATDCTATKCLGVKPVARAGLQDPPDRLVTARCAHRPRPCNIGKRGCTPMVSQVTSQDESVR